MKKRIGYISAWALFWSGHLMYLLMHRIPKLYPIYRWSMLSSIKSQEWAGIETPWAHIKNKMTNAGIENN
ncbi:hypothetical protein UFOVP449_4 [uncultured Caudovirales phage]|uniref:Uncharacterized protein n=1 Tax=uncultured Caudovirales phage TaxID=2100421 RepID=A0A6J5M9A1_9CAUD|nr:hypothetical protein UFOVP449_4 [uncultured Caudovirales phage]